MVRESTRVAVFWPNVFQIQVDMKKELDDELLYVGWSYDRTELLKFLRSLLAGKSYVNCILYALKVKDHVFQWIFSTTNQAETWVICLFSLLLYNVFSFSIMLSVCLFLLILLPWALQRGLLLVVNWELVTVLVYRGVSWGSTCVETGFKDWLDFCKVVSPCFLSCVPENIIWLRTWEVRYKMPEKINDSLVGWLYIKRTDWLAVSQKD